MAGIEAWSNDMDVVALDGSLPGGHTILPEGFLVQRGLEGGGGGGAGYGGRGVAGEGGGHSGSRDGVGVAASLRSAGEAVSGENPKRLKLTEIPTMTVAKLKEELARRGASKQGNKPELVRRLSLLVSGPSPHPSPTAALGSLSTD